MPPGGLQALADGGPHSLQLRLELPNHRPCLFLEWVPPLDAPLAPGSPQPGNVGALPLDMRITQSSPLSQEC